MDYLALMTLYNERYDSFWDACRAGDNSLKAIMLVCLVAVSLIISVVSLSNKKRQDEKDEDEAVMAGVNTVNDEVKQK